MYTVIIQTPASIDIDEAFVWYEDRKVGLGFKLIDDIDTVITKISNNPFFAKKIYNEIRAAALDKFPYELIYLVEAETNKVVVIACSHFKRTPFWYTPRT